MLIAVSHTLNHGIVSSCLLEYAAFGGVDINVLLRIIPYGCCEYTLELKKVQDILEKSGELQVSKETFDKVKGLIDNLPTHSPSGLGNICARRSGAGGTGFGEFLLRKLRVTSEGKEE